MTRSTFCNNDRKKEIRDQIDRLDRSLISSLEKRLSFVFELKDCKKRLTDKKREEEILKKIANPYIRMIYQTIFKSSKKMLKDRK
jgi:chorismate mutase